MCLTIPARIESVDRSDPANVRAVVDYDGLKRNASLLYLPHAKVGDFVIVQAGYATTEVTEPEAREAWRYLREMNAEHENARTPAADDRPRAPISRGG